MKLAEVQKISHGLYKIYWKSGGYSLAAIGSLPDGKRWLAPTNWIGGMGTGGYKIWRDVEKVTLIKSRDEKWFE